MGGDAQPTAHDDAVHPGYERLGVVRDGPVHGVLVGQKARRGGVRIVDSFADGTDVAARAQTPFPRPRYEDSGDSIVLGPGVQLILDRVHHRRVQRVDRLRPVQDEVSQAPADGRQHLAALAYGLEVWFALRAHGCILPAKRKGGRSGCEAGSR